MPNWAEDLPDWSIYSLTRLRHVAAWRGSNRELQQDPGGKRKRFSPQIRGNCRAMKIKDSCKENSMTELLISCQLSSADVIGLPVQCQLAGFLPIVIKVFAKQWRQHFPVIKLSGWSSPPPPLPHQPLSLFLKANRLSDGWKVLQVPELKITTACSLPPSCVCWLFCHQCGNSTRSASSVSLIAFLLLRPLKNFHAEQFFTI